MNTKLLRLGRKLWSSPTVPREMNRRNLREWARALRTVGDKWQLATYQPRKTPREVPPLQQGV